MSNMCLTFYYIKGVAGIVWAILWFYNIYESPFEHETIGQEEKLFIESTLAFVIFNDFVIFFFIK
jgi:hypothetical protein